MDGRAYWYKRVMEGGAFEEKQQRHSRAWDMKGAFTWYFPPMFSFNRSVAGRFMQER